MSHDPHMPGAWICPQCGATIQKTIVNATATSPIGEIFQNEYAPIVRAADVLEDHLSLICRFQVIDWDALTKLNNELRDALKPYRRTNNAFAKAVAENLPKP